MDAEAVDVCKLMVADLANRAGDFAVGGWTPKRAFVPQYKLKDLRSVQVVAVPASLAGDRQTRGRIRRRVGVYLGVLKLLECESSDQAASDDDLAELDGLLLFMEQLARLFVPVEGTERYRLGNGGKYLAAECSSVPLFSIEDMQTNRQFTGVLSVTFEVG